MVLSEETSKYSSTICFFRETLSHYLKSGSEGGRQECPDLGIQSVIYQFASADLLPCNGSTIFQYGENVIAEIVPVGGRAMGLCESLDEIECLSYLKPLRLSIQQRVNHLLCTQFKLQLGPLFPVLLVNPRSGCRFNLIRDLCNAGDPIGAVTESKKRRIQLSLTVYYES